MTSQSFTFIDPAGNQAQYNVYDADRHNEYHWSTDHGDCGFEASYTQAQNRARAALKSSMAGRRRSDQSHQKRRKQLMLDDRPPVFWGRVAA